jgi:hypothetical protein
MAFAMAQSSATEILWTKQSRGVQGHKLTAGADSELEPCTESEEDSEVMLELEETTSDEEEVEVCPSWLSHHVGVESTAGSARKRRSGGPTPSLMVSLYKERRVNVVCVR